MDYDDEEQYNEALEEEEDSLLSELLKLHKKLDRVRFTNNSNNEPNNSNKIFDGFNALMYVVIVRPSLYFYTKKEPVMYIVNLLMLYDQH